MNAISCATRARSSAPVAAPTQSRKRARFAASAASFQPSGTSREIEQMHAATLIRETRKCGFLSR
jgi:hypothetical protein